MSEAASDRRAAMRAEIESMAARIELQLLAAIMSAPASAHPASSDDPIFALIEADRQDAEQRSRHAEGEGAPTLFTTEPATVAGAAALMSYVVELIDGCDGPDRNDNRPLFWSLPLHRTLVHALAKMAVACGGALPPCEGS